MNDKVNDFILKLCKELSENFEWVEINEGLINALAVGLRINPENIDLSICQHAEFEMHKVLADQVSEKLKHRFYAAGQEYYNSEGEE
jgi:hypothetical protein